MMMRNLATFVLCFLFNTPTCSHNQCRSHSLTNSFIGRYCPTEGAITPNIPWYECKLLCMQTPSCQAVNYNIVTSSCTNITKTCPQAILHPSMTFTRFTAIRPEQCIEWIERGTGLLPGDRAMTEDNMRFMARMQKDGDDFMCYMLTPHNHCYYRDIQGVRFDSNTGGYPCQLLRIRDGCTVLYMSYDLGTPLPPNALIGGYTAGGLPCYIVQPHAFYVPGPNSLIGKHRIANNKVQLLVSL